MADKRTSGWVVGRLLGAPVIVQPLTLVMLAVLAFLFASGSGATTARSLAVGGILAGSLLVSVFLHEVAHALAARAFGRRVAEIVLTLWGGHTSFDAAALTPLVNGVTAVAGPAMNLAIAGAARASLEVIAEDTLAGAILAYVAWANVMLAVFNLLPGIPMDGGKVLESLVWAGTKNRLRGTWIAAWGGHVVVVVVVAYVLGGPLLVGGRPSVVDLVAAGLIASVLWPAASAARRFSSAMLRRDGVTVKGFMVPAVAVEYTVSLDDAATAAQAAGADEVVVLGVDGVPAGRFPTSAIAAVPVHLRATTSLQAVTLPLPRGAEIDLGAQADVMIPALRTWWGKTEAWVVRDGAAVVGIVRLVDVVAALK